MNELKEGGSEVEFEGGDHIEVTDYNTLRSLVNYEINSHKRVSISNYDIFDMYWNPCWSRREKARLIDEGI